MGKKQEPMKTHKVPVEHMTVYDDMVALEVAGAKFHFTLAEIDQFLSEGWMESESAISEVDGIYLELYPRDYRTMRRMINLGGN
jgi:hypothetical protein